MKVFVENHVYMQDQNVQIYMILFSNVYKNNFNLNSVFYIMQY